MPTPTGILFQNPIVKPLSSNATFMSGCTATFYVTGTTSLTPVYADGNLATPLANPLSADASGTFQAVYMDPAVIYRVQIKTSAGVLISDTDPYIPSGLTNLTAGQIGQILYPRTPAEIAVSVTPTVLNYPSGNVLRYGADLTGATDSQPAFLNAQKVATQGSVTLVIPGGTYKIATTLNWGFTGLRVRADGNVVLNFTNSGQAVTLDGGATGPGVNDVRVDGYIRVVGNASTTDAWFLRACHRSHISSPHAGDCTTGFRLNWCVATTLEDPTCSVNEASFPVQTPLSGIVLDKRGSGETTSACLILRPIIEGVSGTGILIPPGGSLQTMIIGGTSEANGTGMSVASGNVGTIVEGTDFEANSVYDILVTGGSRLTLIDINSLSNTSQPNIDLQGGDNTTFVNGFQRWVHVVTSPTVTGTSFLNNQVSNGSTVGIKLDAGAIVKSVGVQNVNGSGVVDLTKTFNDDVGEKGTFTPTISGGSTPGTQSYSVQAGFYQRVGHVVTVQATVTLSANSGGTGTAILGGLPFTNRNLANCIANIAVNDYTGVTLGATGRKLSLVVQPAASTGAFLETDTGSVRNPIAIGSFSGTASVTITGTYLID